MVYGGVDLAWSQNNVSGVATVKKEGDSYRVEYLDVADTLDTIQGVVRECRVVAIDAPLIVPNETGQRPAETELRKDFGRYNAGAYPANRAWLTKMCGEVRGEVLANNLRADGFTHNPYLEKPGPSVIEVYPHPATISFFNLDTVIPYKARKGRTKKKRIVALQRFERLLRRHVDIPQRFDYDVTLKDLNRVEDKLDAVLCAYTAAWLCNNSEDVAVYGNRDEGYITTLKPPA